MNIKKIIIISFFIILNSCNSDCNKVIKEWKAINVIGIDSSCCIIDTIFQNKLSTLDTNKISIDLNTKVINFINQLEYLKFSNTDNDLYNKYFKTVDLKKFSLDGKTLKIFEIYLTDEGCKKYPWFSYGNYRENRLIFQLEDNIIGFIFGSPERIYYLNQLKICNNEININNYNDILMNEYNSIFDNRGEVPTPTLVPNDSMKLFIDEDKLKMEFDSH